MRAFVQLVVLLPLQLNPGNRRQTSLEFNQIWALGWRRFWLIAVRRLHLKSHNLNSTSPTTIPPVVHIRSDLFWHIHTPRNLWWQKRRFSISTKPSKFIRRIGCIIKGLMQFLYVLTTGGMVLGYSANSNNHMAGMCNIDLAKFFSYL